MLRLYAYLTVAGPRQSDTFKSPCRLERYVDSLTCNVGFCRKLPLGKGKKQVLLVGFSPMPYWICLASS